MALYVDSVFLNDIMEVARAVPQYLVIEEAVTKFAHDQQMMKKL
jgi:hypothetical protein